MGSGGPTPCTYDIREQIDASKGVRINPRTKYMRGIYIAILLLSSKLSLKLFTCIDTLPFPNTEVWTLNVALMDKVCLLHLCHKL